MFSLVGQDLAQTRGEEARCDVHDQRDQLGLLGRLGREGGDIVFTGGNKGGVDQVELPKSERFDRVAVLFESVAPGPTGIGSAGPSPR